MLPFLGFTAENMCHGCSRLILLASLRPVTLFQELERRRESMVLALEAHGCFGLADSNRQGVLDLFGFVCWTSPPHLFQVALSFGGF